MRPVIPHIKPLGFPTLVACLLALPSAAWGQGGGGLPRPSFQWRCAAGDTTLNFHPATTAPLAFDSVPYAESHTVVAVYRPVADAEAAVWRLQFAGGAYRGLTTRRILSDNGAVRYTETTGPAISTLRQSAPDSASPHARLALGGDTLPGRVAVAEVRHYGRRLTGSEIRRTQSELAIRYGITLGPVSYLDARGNKVWHYADSGLYHHRVTGVGRDSASHLHQRRSRSEMAGALLTLTADSLAEGCYLLCGDNDAPPLFDTAGSRLLREWRAEATGTGGDTAGPACRVSLTFNIRGLGTQPASLVLLMDKDTLRPSHADADSVRFDRVPFTRGVHHFTLGDGALAQQPGKGSPAQERAEPDSGHVAVRLYPNPTTGPYTLVVAGADRVRAYIYNTQGLPVAEYSANGQAHCRFAGTLPAGNAYYATVDTDGTTQTIKIVVR